VITLIAVVLITAAAHRGFKRGASREVLDLLLVVIGFPIAFRIGGPLGEQWFGQWAPLASRTLGALVIFGLLAVLAAFGRRYVAGPGIEVDQGERALGATVGGIRGAVLAFIVLAVAAASPTSSAMGQAAQRSTAVRVMTNPTGLPMTLFEAATGEQGMTALISFNRSFPDGPLITDDYRQLPAFAASELERIAADGIEILDLVNDERTSMGALPLNWSSALTEVAMSYAEEMYEGGFFSHDSTRTGDVGDRLGAANIRYGLAGENLALAPNVGAVHRGLMNSPGHRANILLGDFTHIGIGVVEGPIGLMVVQVFLAG